MKLLIGVILVLCGVALGLYVGVWLCLVGGIVQIIEACKAPVIEALPIGIGVARIVCATLAGWLSALLLIIPGMAFISSDK